MAQNNDWKDRLNVVFSTNPDFKYQTNQCEENETLPPNKQHLYLFLDKKQRAGKKVTIVKGFVGKNEDLKNLGKEIKIKCGVGGSIKDGEIIIQGDFCNKISDILTKAGYKTKRSGG